MDSHLRNPEEFRKEPVKRSEQPGITEAQVAKELSMIAAFLEKILQKRQERTNMHRVHLEVMSCALLVPHSTGVLYYSDSPRGNDCYEECEGYYLPVDVWNANWNLELIPFGHPESDFHYLGNHIPSSFILVLNEQFKNSSSEILNQLVVDESMIRKSYMTWIYCIASCDTQSSNIRRGDSVILVSPSWSR